MLGVDLLSLGAKVITRIALIVLVPINIALLENSGAVRLEKESLDLVFAWKAH